MEECLCARQSLKVGLVAHDRYHPWKIKAWKGPKSRWIDERSNVVERVSGQAMQRAGVTSYSYQTNVNPSKGDGISSAFICNICLVSFNLASFSWSSLIVISSGRSRWRLALQVGI